MNKYHDIKVYGIFKHIKNLRVLNGNEKTRKDALSTINNSIIFSIPHYVAKTKMDDFSNWYEIEEFNLPYVNCIFNVHDDDSSITYICNQNKNDGITRIFVCIYKKSMPYNFLYELRLYKNNTPTYKLLPIESGPLTGNEDTDATSIVFQIATILELLKCKNVYTQNNSMPNIIKNRIKNKKLPTYSYKTLILFDEEKTVSKNSNSGTHASPRVHLRRGHIRRLPNGNTIWVNECVVGDKEKGMVHKDYKITTQSYNEQNSAGRQR